MTRAAGETMGEPVLKVVCTIIVLDSGSVHVDFRGPVAGKPGRLELLRAAMEIVRQGDE
jgi:hypothetical protein